MIVPVAPWVLDLLLSLNIALALVILLTSLYTENALAFSVFPTLLLIVTLFRLSLNITGRARSCCTATRARSSRRSATIVVGGNYAVGIVIFAILVVIQFVVITNGAGRVAEVAARFTSTRCPANSWPSTPTSTPG
jgi:flagellar biosynthesis protein FlhA